MKWLMVSETSSKYTLVPTSFLLQTQGQVRCVKNVKEVRDLAIRMGDKEGEIKCPWMSQCPSKEH